MNTKKFLFAAVGYIIVTFIIAAGWHLVLFKSVYAELGIFTRKEPLIPLGLISMVIQGVVLAYLYPFFKKDGTPMKDGLKFGLLMGIFMGSNAVFAEAGKNEVTSLSTWLLLESIYYIVQFAITGTVIGLIFGKTSGESHSHF